MTDFKYPNTRLPLNEPNPTPSFPQKPGKGKGSPPKPEPDPPTGNIGTFDIYRREPEQLDTEIIEIAPDELEDI
jgi:hypothetical protein